jgi:hypothetical protein
MYLDGLKDTIGSFRASAIDTTFVLFFLGLEFGRTLQNFTFDAFLLLLTMAMVAVLPYYLPSSSERPAFARWLTGRMLIVLLAVAVGAILKPAYGTVLPESFRFLPLTFLILTAMTSCFIQFYALMRLCLAK